MRTIAHGRNLRPLMIGTSLCALVAAALPAHAQSNAEDTMFDEIIVTAQKREQSILDVPISMTAFSAEDLEKQRVQKVEDFLLVSPGVQYVESSDFLKTVSIRGLNDSGGGLWQTTGVTIDDATLIQTYNGFLLTSRLFDIERVEILRGPQGTLTGGNSTAGTINIITKKPSLDAFEGEATLDYGRFNTKLVRGSANVPLSDTVAVRASAYMESTDGSLKNIGPAGGGSNEDHFGVRVAMRWKPSENLTLDASFNYEHQKYGSQNALHLIDRSYDDPANAGRWWADTVSRNIGAFEAAGGNLDDKDFIRDVGLNGATISTDIAEKTEHKLWFATFRGEYEMEDHSIMAMYTRYEHDVETLYDEDKSEFAYVYSAWDGGPSSDYGEIRINSDYDGPLNWVAGASYAKERRVLGLRYDITEAFLAGYFGVGDIANTDPINGPYFTDYWENTLEQIESTGIFANAFYDISDRIHVSVGGRVSFVKTATQSQFNNEGIFGSFDNPVTSSETTVDPRIAINFDLTDDVTTYIQYATGYRAGYGNTGPAVELGLGPAEVDSEKLKNYELGIKGRFFDRRLSLAAAVYYMDYTNMQVGQEVFVDDTVGEVDFDNNANSAEAKGFEIEGDLFVTENLVISGAVSYVETAIEELNGFEDLAFPRVGPWTIDASFEYTHDISDDMWASFRAQYSYRDGYVDWFPWLDVGDIGTIPSYNLVDVTAGIHKEKWSAVAYMDNIFNEIYWQGTDIGYNTGGATVPYNARAFGLRFTIRH